ncbi:MAG: DMT family transporter [Alphaproteobacteria bacterium]|nr:DMT family transporter [Alphaproteobacteria bacterium]
MTHVQGMLYALATFFLWVIVDTGMKIGGMANVTPFLIVGIFGAVGVMGTVGAALAKRKLSLLVPHNGRGLALIALCSFAINAVNVVALKHLPLTVFYVAVFTAPLAIAALSASLKHEKLGGFKILCLIAGFGGVVLAIAPRLVAGGEAIGYLAAAASVACFAVYTVTIRKLSATDTPESIQFAVALFCAIGGFSCALLQRHSLEIDMHMLVILATSAAINIVANFLYNYALKHTTSTNVAQLHYTQIIWGAIIGFALWHELPTWNIVTGAVVIIGAGIIVARLARKEQVMP